MYFVYILYSSKTDRYYTGSTNDLGDRLKHHNYGATPSTKGGAPFWEIKYIEAIGDMPAARKRELEIKKKKSRNYIEFLIRSANQKNPETKENTSGIEPGDQNGGD